MLPSNFKKLNVIKRIYLTDYDYFKKRYVKFNMSRKAFIISCNLILQYGNLEKVNQVLNKKSVVKNLIKLPLTKKKLILFENYNGKNNYSLKKYITLGFSIKESINLIKEIKNKTIINKENLIKKYDKEEGLKKWKEIKIKQKSYTHSHKADMFFEKLISKIKSIKKDITIFYKDNEYILINGFQRYYIDFYIPELKLSIEYNGRFWHCYPKEYSPYFIHPVNNKFAKDIWKNDIQKWEAIIKYFDLFIVWEDISEDKRIDELVFEIFKRYNKIHKGG